MTFMLLYWFQMRSFIGSAKCMHHMRKTIARTYEKDMVRHKRQKVGTAY
jgi:hypothetical protein